jgi:hypothetical protein
VAAGLTVTAVHTSPAYSRIVSSTQSFRQYFKELKGAGNSLNPIERFVFSLVLANTKAPQPEQQGTAPAHRT